MFASMARMGSLAIEQPPLDAIARDIQAHPPERAALQPLPSRGADGDYQSDTLAATDWARQLCAGERPCPEQVEHQPRAAGNSRAERERVAASSDWIEYLVAPHAATPRGHPRLCGAAELWMPQTIDERTRRVAAHVHLGARDPRDFNPKLGAEYRSARPNGPHPPAGDLERPALELAASEAHEHRPERRFEVGQAMLDQAAEEAEVVVAEWSE